MKGNLKCKLLGHKGFLWCERCGEPTKVTPKQFKNFMDLFAQKHVEQKHGREGE